VVAVAAAACSTRRATRSGGGTRARRRSRRRPSRAWRVARAAARARAGLRCPRCATKRRCSPRAYTHARALTDPARAQQIDNLRKENFDLQLKLHFLQERLAQLAPDQVKQALEQNIHLKVEVQTRQREGKKAKKRVAELERALDDAAAERAALESDLRRADTSMSSGSARVGEELRALERENDALRADMDELRVLTQEHVDEKERLQDLLDAQPAERSRSFAASDAGDRRLRARVAELEAALRRRTSCHTKDGPS
jgi:DNA repair exonuclease SbcCD ATPase subunit